MDERPWLQHYGAVPPSLPYPATTLYGALAATAARTPDAIAWEFLDATCSYSRLLAEVDRCAAALAGLGIAAGDRVTVALPTCPQGVIAFYAANRLGAVASMVHPLSTPEELGFYLRLAGSRVAITLDAFVPAFDQARDGTPLQTLVVARLPDYLDALHRLGFWWTRGRHIPSVPARAGLVQWREWLRRAPGDPPIAGGPEDVAAILYSGGTTGQPKGVLLSNRNFVAEGMQVAAWARVGEGDSMLAIMPLFHGFGLGVCVNATLMAGGRAILVPTFTAEAVADLIRRKRPTFVAGVPTLYAALARDPALERADLSCLRAAFSGADTLPRHVKDEFEALVRRRGGHVRLLEGYGLTEAVSAIMATPTDGYRDGTIGVPFPDTDACICAPDSVDPLPPDTEGEICIAGPAVMLGYLDAPEETARTLRPHADGRSWLHTGDLGRMDADGYFRFTCRLKRMIKSSGFNVYPAQVEAVLLQHEAVAEACVVGVPDERQVERVVACIVPKDPAAAGDALARELIAHCRTHLIKWSCPRTVLFREALPRTRIGKIDYRRVAAIASAADAHADASGPRAASTDTIPSRTDERTVMRRRADA
jgi:long-chain acyl-CoA synthetase